MRDTTKLMMTRISQRLAEMGISERALSLRATGTDGAIREIKRGKMPGAARLNALAAAMGVDPRWLISDEQQPPAAVDSLAPPAYQPAAVAAPTRGFNAFDLPRDLPVLGSVLGCANGDFSDGPPVETHLVEMGDTIDMVRRPSGLANAKSAYALYISGDSQAPRFEPGDLIFVNPARPPAIGDDVVVQMTGDDGRIVTALIKRLVRRTASSVVLLQFNPEREIIVPTGRIAAIHRITPLAELLGI